MQSVKDRVLEQLEQHRGEYLSGEMLADALSVSRNAVWKAVKALREVGYPIDAKPNCGYALSDDCAILSKQSVERFLDVPLRVQVYGEVDSTNTLVRQAAEAGEAEGLIIIASKQTAGRGRRGRSFHSPESTGLYMTALLRPDLAAQDAALMTTLAAVAVAEAIEAVSGRESAIKWVNDVYLDGKKVCGILTEAAMDLETGKLSFAAVGIGVNLVPPMGGFPADIQNIACAVFEHLPTPDAASRLAAEIWNRFFQYYRHLPNTGFLDAYRRRSFLLGREIEVLRGNEAIPAVAIAIDDRAGLTVRYADGREETLSSGEVSVRGAR